MYTKDTNAFYFNVPHMPCHASWYRHKWKKPGVMLFVTVTKCTGNTERQPQRQPQLYSDTWELGTPKGLWKTVLNSEVVLFLSYIAMYWICLGTEVTVLSSQVVPISQVVLKTGFTVLIRYLKILHILYHDYVYRTQTPVTTDNVTTTHNVKPVTLCFLF